MFELFSQGNGLRKIARRLGEKGIKPSKGQSWDISAINYILHNTTYLGWREYGKTKKVKLPNGKKSFRLTPEATVRHKQAHEPIVPQELWDKAQAMMAQGRQAGRGVAKIRGRRTIYSEHLLTGILTCGECGANFFYSPTAAGRAHYRCGWNQRRGAR